MARSVAVVIVHGIRTEERGYSAAFQARVTRALPKKLRGQVEWREVFWGDITLENKRAYFRNANARRVLPWGWLRRDIVINGLGDAAAYSLAPRRQGSIYSDIQERISAQLDDLDRAGPADRPLIFVGHSLGCHIISSYLWDRNRLKHANPDKIEDPDAAEEARRFKGPLSPFRKLNTVAAFLTLGSNMPLFTFAYEPESVFPITHAPAEGIAAAFPGSDLPPALKGKARWINIYSPYDVLGYPLKCLNKAYAEAVSEDVEVITGGVRYMDPICAHVTYWSHRTVIRRAAGLVREVVETT